MSPRTGPRTACCCTRLRTLTFTRPHTQLQQVQHSPHPSGWELGMVAGVPAADLRQNAQMGKSE